LNFVKVFFHSLNFALFFYFGTLHFSFFKGFCLFFSKHNFFFFCPKKPKLQNYPKKTF